MNWRGRSDAPHTGNRPTSVTGAPLIRVAVSADVPALTALIQRSARELSRGFYTEREAESAITHVFGIDSSLLADATYYAVEVDGALAACGGWSRRRTLYGGDQRPVGEPAELLDPANDAARIRAFFVSPDFARRGLGRRLLDHCSTAATAAGFSNLELMATLPGVPFYTALGFREVAPVQDILPDGVPLAFVRMARGILETPVAEESTDDPTSAPAPVRVYAAPLIETRRLAIRPLTLDDAGFVWELLNDDDFLKFIGDRGVRTVDDAIEYLKQGPLEMYERLGFGLWCVELKTTHTTIGICGLLKRDWLDDVDIGFAFLSEFRGRGYAFEASRAVIAHAIDTLGIQRLAAIVSPANAKSQSLLGRLGMRYRSLVRAPNGDHDVQLFTIGIGEA